jgi:hypothetical protein
LKVVAGVIAACLCLVAIAGLKVLYLRMHTPAVVPIEESAVRLTPPAPSITAATAPETAPAAAMADEKPEATAASSVASLAPATPAAAARRAAPVHAPRVTAKPSTRRPLPKKVGKSTH